MAPFSRPVGGDLSYELTSSQGDCATGSYVPERGRILVGGVDLAQVDPAWLQRQVGVVLQENFLPPLTTG